MSFHTVLFDLDGTLIDSRADLTDAVNHALMETGQPKQTQEQIVPRVGNGLRDLLRDVMGPVSDAILERGIKAFSEFYQDHCVDKTVLYDGVKEGLKDLAAGAKLGVVTNKPKKFSEEILSKLGVSPYFTCIIGGDSLPERKPHPAPVLAAVERIGGKTSATLMLGDSVQDIRAGQAAGTRTCLARYGYGFSTDFLKLNPDYSIGFFREIKEIVL